MPIFLLFFVNLYVKQVQIYNLFTFFRAAGDRQSPLSDRKTPICKFFEGKVGPYMALKYPKTGAVRDRV